MLKSDPRARRGLDLIEELDDRLEKLKHEYDVYFAGISHIDPAEKKVPIRRIITKLNEMHLVNPRLRFQFQSLVGRFVSLNQYWTRIQHEIDEGRYSRDIFRANLKAKNGETKAYFGKEAPKMPGSEARDEKSALKNIDIIGAPQQDEKIRRDDIEERQITERELKQLKLEDKVEVLSYDAIRNEREANISTPEPERRSGQDAFDKLYSDYQQAQKRRGVNVDAGIEKETVRQQIEMQRERLIQKYGGGVEVDFQISEKEDKVSLKPIIRKKT